MPNAPIKLWLSADELEESARTQLQNLATLPFIAQSGIAVMPDCHAGIGSTVGSVIATQGAIVPSAVGVDIGCFVGDTGVFLADGTVRPIKDLAELNQEIDVLAYDSASSRVKIAKATAKKTGTATQLLCVSLPSFYIYCTPDHQFLLDNGDYLEARFLTVQHVLKGFNPHAYCLASLSPKKKKEFEEKAQSYQIEGISRASWPEPEGDCSVYCLQVPGYNNFLLEAGVFVHNCGMQAAKTNLVADDLQDLKGLRHQIERDIPIGVGGTHQSSSQLYQLNVEHVPEVPDSVLACKGSASVPQPRLRRSLFVF